MSKSQLQNAAPRLHTPPLVPRNPGSAILRDGRQDTNKTMVDVEDLHVKMDRAMVVFK